MVSYFIRRLLLVPVTFVCITFLVYIILRLAPSGPIEQARQQMLAQQAEGGRGSGGLGATGELEMPKEALEQLQRYWKLDRHPVIGYAIWLGVWPDRSNEGRFSGVLQGDFGRSIQWSEPVLKSIRSRLPVSIYFGLIGFFATWLVCIPLGVQKAIRHRSLFDTASSLVVFVGYAIPGFVAALVLLLLFATDLIGCSLLPLGRFRSEGWDDWWARGEYWRCIRDQVSHTIIPIAGYLIGGFATMTILMKNSLLDNLGSDYVRTAFAKGLPERRVIFVHALRNSLIPLAVSAGHVLGLLFAGSFLIEKTCNIPGMGLLGYDALLFRDIPLQMGTLVFIVLIQLTGNIFSDVLLAIVDPRVRFK
jgi:microcin C transport system permease protein